MSKYKLKQIEAKNNSLVLYFDDFFIKVNEKVNSEFYLYTGKVLDNNEYNDLINKSMIYDTYDLALKFVKAKYRSVNEVKEYLIKEEASFIDDAILKLKESNILNDTILSSFIVDSYKDFKGIHYIRNKLEKRLVEEDTIDLSLKDINTEYEINVIIRIIDKLKNTYSKFPLNVQRIKFEQYFLRNGFLYDDINKALNLATLIDNSESELYKDLSKLKKKYPGKDLSNNLKIISSLQRKGYPLDKIKDAL